MNVFYFLYNSLWTVAYILLLPFIILGKKDYFSRKFALNLPAWKKGRGRIWIHALSVGEVISTRPFIQAIKKRFSDRPIVLTVKTFQGMKVAKKELKGEVDDLFFMPLDYRGAIARIVKAVNPCIFILVETDIWPGLISYLKNRGIKIILVNGRVSPRTFRGYKRFRFYFKWILNDIDLLLMQSDLDSRRIREIGVSPDKVMTAGNIKFDREWVSMDREEHNNWMERLYPGTGSKIFVAGSTHEGEDEQVLRVFKRLVEKHRELVLIIAPRKLDRVDAIESMGQDMGLKIIKRTALEKNNRQVYNCLILDTIGELGRIYGLASISFVGGSLVPIGGHNLLEPASFGCPVLFGKHTHNFVLMSELLLEHGGGKRIEDSEDLFRTLNDLLSDPAKADKMGRNAKNFVEANSGAVNRIIDCIGGDIASN